MSRVEAVAASDRLPWLSDDTKPPPVRRQGGSAVGWAAGAILLVAGFSYWAGTNSVEELPPPRAERVRPATTVRLPEARPPLQRAEPQVQLKAVPEVEPIVAPPMPVIDEPKVVRRAPEKVVVPSKAAEPTVKAEVEAKPVPSVANQIWPVRVIEGASGRLVRVGAFSTVHQAKRGWWAIVRVNPTLKRLPALVVPVQSLRNGRVYYRLQMGTTSQAHSTVLCQRMRMIAQSCVVIGPGRS